MAISKKNRWLATAFLAATITACFAFFIVANNQLKDFDSMEEFSAVWMKTPENDRHELLEWLVGKEPSRHTAYPLGRTQLNGLTRDQVEAYLGTPSGPLDGMVYYRIGSIESDPVGFLVPGFSKADVLMIKFDDNDIVEHVEITS